MSETKATTATGAPESGTATLADHAPRLERAFDFEPTPDSYTLPEREIEGAVPGFLRGTYYLNGPGSFRRGDLAYHHWLDGDGLVSSLELTDRGVHFTTRWVDTRKRRDEEEAGRALYRTFGTAFEGDRLVHGIGLASPINVSAYRWCDALLAFGEQGLPWALDPDTLETRGEHDFGRLSRVAPISAHPHFDRDTGEMFNFGISYARNRPALHLYRFGRDGGLLSRRRVPLDLPCSLHDFALGRRWAAFHLAPYLLQMDALLDRGASVQEALSWQPEHGSHLLVVDRETGETVTRVQVGQGYSLHHINTFEDGDRLVVDLMEFPEPIYPQYQTVPDLFTDVPAVRPVRLVVDPQRGRLVERHEVPYPLAADFPSVDPRLSCKRYRRFWKLAISATGQPGRKFFDRLVAFDWDEGGVTGVYASPPGCYLGGEPVLLPDPAVPEQGVVICQELDVEARRTSFLLFDALDPAAGPVARLPLRAPIPLGFHASFEPAQALEPMEERA